MLASPTLPNSTPTTNHANHTNHAPPPEMRYMIAPNSSLAGFPMLLTPYMPSSSPDSHSHYLNPMYSHGGAGGGGGGGLGVGVGVGVNGGGAAAATPTYGQPAYVQFPQANGIHLVPLGYPAQKQHPQQLQQQQQQQQQHQYHQQQQLHQHHQHHHHQQMHHHHPYHSPTRSEAIIIPKGNGEQHSTKKRGKKRGSGRRPQYPEMEEYLRACVSSQPNMALPVSHAISLCREYILQHHGAVESDAFKFSDGWFSNMMKRQHLYVRQKNLCAKTAEEVSSPEDSDD